MTLHPTATSRRRPLARSGAPKESRTLSLRALHNVLPMATLLALAGAPAATGSEISFVCAAATCRAPATLPLPHRSGEIALQNLDPAVAVTPYLHREDWPDLRGNRRILASILKPGMSSEARALAIWEFMRRWRFSCAPYSDQSQALHDPVKLVNAFGCGLCDDSNAALASLAALAGMPARLWGLTGHVVAEVSWDGAWHLLDAADGVYFRDESGTIAGVEALAQRPALIHSATNRQLRRSGVRRMAELIAHGAGPAAGGHRAAVQTFFDRRWRDFLGARGESAAAAQPPDLALLDRIVFTRYAEIVASTGDNAISQWWNTEASEQEVAVELHPLDRLVFALRPVTEAGMPCYVGADDCFDGSGRLERAALAPLGEIDAASGKTVFAEELPYVIETIAIDGSAQPPGARTDVYVSFAGGSWSRIGVLESTTSPAPTASPEAGQTPQSSLEFRMPAGSEPRFAYRLRFLRRGTNKADPAATLRLATGFRVAAKSLPWPAPGAARVMVETGLTRTTPPAAGLRVTFRRDD